MRRHTDHPTRLSKQATRLDAHFPAVSSFVRTQGWIEIGDQEGVGFIVRALDYGGLVFETRKPHTLAGAMTVLERRLAALAER